jgi:hypothetical protein
MIFKFQLNVEAKEGEVKYPDASCKKDDNIYARDWLIETLKQSIYMRYEYIINHNINNHTKGTVDSSTFNIQQMEEINKIEKLISSITEVTIQK